MPRNSLFRFTSRQDYSICKTGIYREGAERWLKVMSEYRTAERIFCLIGLDA
jgi:hypothetical protein